MASNVSGIETSYMKQLGYHEIKETNKEFLRTDLWEFRFTIPPAIVYYPGDSIIQTRLTQVNTGIDTSVTGFEKHMRNTYTLHQRTGQRTDGTLSLTFVDREDQAITYFIDDWRQKIADRDSKYSFRKEDLVAQCEFTILNTSRLPVRRLRFYNCYILDGSFDESGASEDGGDRADVQINMSFEHYEALRRKISLKMRKGSKSDLNALERFIYLPIAKAS